MIGALPAWHIWNMMDLVLHPPLYILMLRFWRDAFGESVGVARANGAQWAAVAIVSSTLIARLALGRVTAVLAALAMTLEPTQVYFAQEIRGYAVLAGLASLGLWLMTRIELLGPTRRRAVALGLVPLALLLTHYFGVGAAISVAAFGFWRLPGQRKAFAGTLAATGLVYLVAWVPFAVEQLDDVSGGDEFVRVAPFDWLDEAAWLACAPIRLLIDRSYMKEPTSLVSGALVLTIPWLLFRRQPAPRPWAVWLTCSLLPLVALDAGAVDAAVRCLTVALHA